MTWFDWFLVVLFSVSVVANIALIGKPRKPISPLDAVVLLIFNGFMIAALLVTRAGL